MNLDEIEKRAAAATPGPWKWKKDNLCAPAPYYVVLKPFYDDDTGEVTTCIFANDKDFIAHARTDIPELIAEVKRLQSELSRQTERADKAEKMAEAAIKDLRKISIANRTCVMCAHDGLCITLPCKVGDTVYVDTRTFMYGDRNGRRHAEGLVTSFVFGHRNFIKFHIFSPYVKHYKVFKYPLSAFGKTVFLTREEAEAEAARKERKK